MIYLSEKFAIVLWGMNWFDIDFSFCYANCWLLVVL